MLPPLWRYQVVFHDVGRTLEECRLLHNNYGVKSIGVVDDTFVLSRPQVMEFCQALQKAKLGLQWACYARVNLGDEKLMEQMAQAGCKEVFYGLESGSECHW